MWPGERTDDALGDVDVRCEKPMQREAGHDDILASANTTATPKYGNRRISLRALEQCEIICGVHAYHTQSASFENRALRSRRGYFRLGLY